VGFFTWLFERKKNKEQFGDGATKGVGSGLWWAAVTMTTVGYGDKAPLTTGGRIIAFIWMFASIIIISSFTAAITTSLTVTQLDTKIKNVNDLYDIRVGTVVSSSSESYLIEKRINYLHYETPPQAIKALAEGEIDAVVYDAPILKYLINENNYSNLLRVLPYNLKPQFYGFSMPFNSELREPINRAILKVINQPGWQKVLYTYLGE
jgi:ABC-type amino acid transport substrate-binding protein